MEIKVTHNRTISNCKIIDLVIYNGLRRIPLRVNLLHVDYPLIMKMQMMPRFGVYANMEETEELLEYLHKRKFIDLITPIDYKEIEPFVAISGTQDSPYAQFESCTYRPYQDGKCNYYNWYKPAIFMAMIKAIKQWRKEIEDDGSSDS